MSQEAPQHGDEKSVHSIETVDFRSEQFDPLKALQLGNLQTPFPDAVALDNIALFKKLLPKSDEGEAVVRKPPPKSEIKSVINPPLKRKSKEKWTSPLNEIMDTLQKGPTSVLYNCHKEKKRVSVKIRSFDNVYCICEGDLLAFDKHLNIILNNVIQRFPGNHEVKSSPQLFIKGDGVILVTRLG